MIGSRLSRECDSESTTFSQVPTSSKLIALITRQEMASV